MWIGLFNLDVIIHLPVAVFFIGLQQPHCGSQPCYNKYTEPYDNSITDMYFYKKHYQTAHDKKLYFQRYKPSPWHALKYEKNEFQQHDRISVRIIVLIYPFHQWEKRVNVK